MSAKLVLLRWAARLVRTEPKQHVVVVAMAAFGIALTTLVTATGGVTEPLVPPYFEAPEYVRVASAAPGEPLDSSTMTAILGLAAAYDDIELQLTTRSTTTGGGNVIGADPTGPIGAYEYSLRAGDWPASGEAALTEAERTRIEASIGQSIQIGDTLVLGGRDRRVSGFWEDPSELSRELTLVPVDETDDVAAALVLLPTPGHPAGVDALAIGDGDGRGQRLTVTIADGFYELGGDDTASGAMYLTATVMCLLVIILASAGLTTIAQRRSRQFGMLSAIGASPSDLASVMIFTGLILGLVGGLIGVVAGAALTLGVVPLIQPFVDRRLDPFDLPWITMSALVPLAVVTVVVAAWRPARRLARHSTMDALASRRPKLARVGLRSVIGAALVAGGTGMLIKGVPMNDPFWVMIGVVLVVVGTLQIVPGFVSLLGRIAGAMPLPLRIALRDIDRNRSRTAAAISAAAIAISIPFGVSTMTAAIDELGLDVTPANAVHLDYYSVDDGEAIDEHDRELFTPFTEAFPNANLVAISSPLDEAGAAATREADIQAGIGADIPLDDYRFGTSIDVLRRSGTRQDTLGIASAEQLEQLGIAPPAPGTDLIVFTESDVATPDLDIKIERRLPYARSYPTALIVGDYPGVDLTNTIVVDWVLVNDVAYTDADLDRLESIAGTSGSSPYSVSLPAAGSPYGPIRIVATLMGILLGIAIVLLVATLIAVEGDSDIRTLNAVGASPRITKTVGAAIAGTIALTASVVAIVTTFLVLSSLFLNPDEDYVFALPWPEILVLTIGLPAFAAAGGWTLATTRTKRQLG